MTKRMNAHAGRQVGLLFILLAAVLWGTVGIFVQTIYHIAQTNPLSIGFLRLAVAAPVLMLGSWRLMGQQMFRIAYRDLQRMLLIGAMTALYQVCFFGAIAQIGVAASTLITLCTAPVWVALLAAVWLHEKLTLSVGLSGLCAVAGTFLLVGQPQAEAQTNPGLGIVLALGSAMGYALMVLCSRQLAGRYEPLQCAAVSFSTGAVILLPFAASQGLVLSYSEVGWLCLLYLGIIPTALAYWLYFVGMRHTPATTASIASLLEPLTATLLACGLFQERLGEYGLVGAVLLLGAIGLLYWKMR